MEYLGLTVQEFDDIIAISLLSAFIAIAEAGATDSLKERIRHPRRYYHIDIYSFTPLKHAFCWTMLAGMLYAAMTGFTIYKATFVVLNAANARVWMVVAYVILDFSDGLRRQLLRRKR